MLAEACLDCLLSADIRRAITAARKACGVAAAAGPGAFAGTMLASALVLGALVGRRIRRITGGV
jgi:hypothetical protein